MPNVFTPLAVPASGVGASSNIEGTSTRKVLQTSGSFDAALTFEVSNDDVNFLPISGGSTPSIKPKEFVARFARARSNAVADIGSAAMNIGAPEGDNGFLALPVPAANGVAAATDVSTLAGERTYTIAGDFEIGGGTIVIEASNDGGLTYQGIIVLNHPDVVMLQDASQFVRVRAQNFQGAVPALVIHVGGPLSTVPSTFVANATTETQNEVDITIAKPVGTTEDDLMVMFYVGEGTNSDLTAGPAGWTQIFNGATTMDAGTEQRLDIWAKLAGPAEPANYTWTTIGNALRGLGAIVTYRDIARAGQPEASAGALIVGDPGANTHIAPSINTILDGAKYLLGYYLRERTNATDPVINVPPATMTSRVDIVHSDNTVGGMRLVIFDQAISPPGATGTRTLTTTTATVDSFGLQYVIKPE